jgi:hypothetical protein
MWHTVRTFGQVVVAFPLILLTIWVGLIAIALFPIWWPVMAYYGGRAKAERDRQELEQQRQRMREELRSRGLME